MQQAWKSKSDNDNWKLLQVLICNGKQRPLTLNICSVSPVDETMCQIWMQSSNLWQSYCDFNIWRNDLECCVTHCARLWDNCHQVWHSTTYLCLNYSIFWCWYVVTLWPWPLTRLILKVCGTSSDTRSKSVQNLRKIEQSPAELLIILQIFAKLLSCCELDLWSLDLIFSVLPTADGKK